MLLYLSSNENIEIFDFLTNEHGIVIKKLSGTFNLKQFVTRDMRSLNHYAYFAIDIVASVCYVEANANDHIKTLPMHCLTVKKIKIYGRKS